MLLLLNVINILNEAGYLQLGRHCEELLEILLRQLALADVQELQQQLQLLRPHAGEKKERTWVSCSSEEVPKQLTASDENNFVCCESPLLLCDQGDV